MRDATSSAETAYRRRWLVRGRVQGVGFRPFVYRLAQHLGLTGHVRNHASDVVIEAQGNSLSLNDFEHALTAAIPPLAVVQHLSRTSLDPVPNETAFIISDSLPGRAPTGITPDSAVCYDCIREMLDPADRRHRHPLISCTNCGPRFSIIHRAPYDRCNTTMAAFETCATCSREYSDPLDRRFHAQPISCHDCGPRIALVDPTGRPLPGDPLAQTAALLQRGQIVAIKGVGGFHLAVRADDEQAVARLRARKRRDAKPFALMVPSLAAAEQLVSLSSAAKELMRGPISPIILAATHPRTTIAPNVAPGTHRLGLMLPNTPIQHLLYAQTPAPPQVIVMTSGNVSDEPLVIDNAEALARLGPLCDAFLWHDRPIARPVDDSIFLDLGEAAPPLPIRRARGLALAPLQLPLTAPLAGLCLGGELKNTVAVVRDDSAILSQHLGDLKHVEAFAHFQRAIRDLQDLYDIQPTWIAHDLHPAYLSTQHARRIAQNLDVPLIWIQHHHAHAAAVLAEHGLAGPAVAIICDGVGYGDDGTIWGGEILLASLTGFERLAALAPLPLPGGDAAAVDTRRCALGLLFSALGPGFDQHPIVQTLGMPLAERKMLISMLRKNVNCVPSSAAGRVFDAVAALLGLCFRNRFEAQAPLALERAAFGVELPATEPLFEIRRGAVERIGLAPLVLRLAEGRMESEPVEELAALFHDQLGWALADAALRAVRRTGVQTAVLSGGAFCNERLTKSLRTRLQDAGVHVLKHERVPPNDGGLALGHAAIAAARVASDC